MMDYMEVPAPLCSYAWVTVNGQPWGLFLAIEEPEEAFARRNFGPDHGALYKPDYRSLNAENTDVALRYIGDDPAAYPNIFDNAKFDTDVADRERLIQALRVLSTGEDLEAAVNADVKPATIRGLESCGMILSADCGDRARVIFADDAEPGAKVR